VKTFLKSACDEAVRYRKPNLKQGLNGVTASRRPSDGNVGAVR